MNVHVIERSPNPRPRISAVTAIGVFDGVHIGHAALLKATVERAHALGIGSAVVTFDRDPEQVVVPDKHIPQLLTLDDKIACISETGIDTVLIVPFDLDIARMAPERFIEDVLVATFEPKEVFVGEDFHFGHMAQGDVALLQEIGTRLGFVVTPMPLVQEGGKPVTATRIRSLIATGEVEEAARLLSRPHRIRGTVVHGRGEGEDVLGIPTANISFSPHAALPRDGVYAGYGSVGEQRFPAAVSVGRPPMYPISLDRMEVHLVGFEGDLYGREVLVEFLARLRDQKVFDSEEELAEAMRSDIEQTVKVLEEGHSD